MNKSKLDRIIQNRAQQRVAAKVAEFQDAIGEAFKKLHPSLAPTYYSGWLPDKIPADVKTILAGLSVGGVVHPRPDANSSYGPQVTWPRILWDTEEAEVEKQLMATLDEMQKALCAEDADKSTVRPAT